MDGVCPVCVIDNSSVLLATGSGADAVIAPEMLAFARTLGFRFRADRVGHPDRKGRIECPFAYIENNFLAARSFEDFDDLNRQAVAWCRDIANHKPKQALGMSPEAAYVIEKPHLRPLPDALPLVYELLERVVARLCLGRHQPLLRSRALRRPIGRRLQASRRDRSMSAARTRRSPFTRG